MIKKVFFQNSQGLKLVGIFDFPKKETKSIIIFAHGFTGDKAEWGRFETAAQEFCKAGFAVFRFDFSGSGESDDDSLTIDKQVDDLTCAIKFVEENGYTSLCLLGLSLGGLISAKVYNKKIKTIVWWAPVTDKVKYSWNSRYSQEQIKELKEKGYITKIRSKGIRRKYIIDKQMLKDRESVNQKELLSLIKCPVLIIHGDKDDRVPIEDSKNAMQYLSSESKLEIIQGANHDFSEELNKIISISLNWFKKYLF